MNGKVVLITGGSGFIGANLVRRLMSMSAEVHVLVRDGSNLWRVPKDVRIHRGDITESVAIATVFASIRPNVIFHTAMPHGHPIDSDSRIEALQTSVMGTALLLENALANRVEKFIHIGSSLEYGPRKHPLRESDDLRPSTFRGITKASASLWCGGFAQATGLPVVELRPFSVYGPWEARSRFIPTVLRSALSGATMPLKRDSQHDFVFVDDVVEACVSAASRHVPPGTAINIGSGQQYSNEAVVAVAERVTGKRIACAVDAHPGNPPDTDCWIADIRKARELLDWQPRHSLEQGLAATFEWLQAHLHLYA
jgi:nucleoside-diphosphate-sugar epimerase